MNTKEKYLKIKKEIAKKIVLGDKTIDELVDEQIVWIRATSDGYAGPIENYEGIRKEYTDKYSKKIRKLCMLSLSKLKSIS